MIISIHDPRSVWPASLATIFPDLDSVTVRLLCCAPSIFEVQSDVAMYIELILNSS